MQEKGEDKETVAELHCIVVIKMIEYNITVIVHLNSLKITLLDYFFNMVMNVFK